MVELAHRGIDQRVAGTAGAPGGKGFRPVGPLNRIVFRLEGMADDARETIEDHEIEIAPDQFAEPDISRALPGAADQFADRNGAEALMYRKIGNALHRRKIAQRTVTLNTPGAEFIPQGPGARHAGLDAEFAQIGGCETDFGQAGYASPFAAGQLAAARVRGAVCCGQPL